MTQQNTNIKNINKFKVKEPGKYKVIMHNDDVTTMDFVVYVLVSIFKMGQNEARTVMLTIHTKGSAVIGVYSYDIAMSKKELVRKMAETNKYPLTVTVKPL